jgi:hypothetical protein
MNNKLAKLISPISENGLLPDTDTHKLRFDIKSGSSNRLYRISVKKSNNEFQCSCPAWIFRRKCKHLDTISPILEKAVKLLELE